MKSKWHNINIGVVWSLIILVIAYLAFYIVYNASWGIGDDAIIIAHTGNGIPFLPSFTINPDGGRLYPFAYLPYNILLLFNSGYITASPHYMINATFFVIMMGALAFLITKVISEKSKSSINRWVVLFVLIVVSQRTYSVFQNVFSTMWLDYTLVAMFILFTYLFYRKQQWGYGIISLLLANYLMYCLEIMFLFPLSFAFVTILFGYKSLTKSQRIFNYILLGSSFLFLSLYYIFIYMHTIHPYDGSHGNQDDLILNALRMFYAQKMLWIAVVILCIRLFDFLFKKSHYDYFYDSLLLASAAYTLGGYILGLNWTLYYAISVIVATPAIVFYMMVYFKKKLTFIVFFLLMSFYMTKYNSMINLNQKNRKETPVRLKQIVDYKNKGYNIIWYETLIPEYNKESFNITLRNWKEKSVRVYLAYTLRNKDFHFDKNLSSKSIILYPSENDLLNKDNTIFDDSLKNYVVIDDLLGIKLLKKE